MGHRMAKDAEGGNMGKRGEVPEELDRMKEEDPNLARGVRRELVKYNLASAGVEVRKALGAAEPTGPATGKATSPGVQDEGSGPQPHAGQHPGPWR